MKPSTATFYSDLPSSDTETQNFNENKFDGYVYQIQDKNDGDRPLSYLFATIHEAQAKHSEMVDCFPGATVIGRRLL